MTQTLISTSLLIKEISGLNRQVDYPYQGKIDIKFDDEISVEVKFLTGYKEQLCITFEDMDFSDSEINFSDGVYRTKPNKIFRDCFGDSRILILANEIEYEFICNISITKIKFKEIESMVFYLYNKSNSLVSSQFSRTTIDVSFRMESVINPEIILEKAEKFIREIKVNQIQLKNKLHKKLSTQKIESWKATNLDNISPDDILDNLDMLHPSYGDGEVFIRGRHFNIGGILTNTLIESPDTLENQILLGGIYSIFKKVKYLQYNLDSLLLENFNRSDDSYIKLGSCLIAMITSQNFGFRCKQLLSDIKKLIYFFENVLQIKFDYSFSRPIMTPTVRSSTLYRKLFERLQEWYQLGDYDFNNSKQFLVKLKSISKIFELFCFYKIIESLVYDGGYNITHVEQESIFPSIIKFDKENNHIVLSYEPRIITANKNSYNHMDLVDLCHSKNELYPYWNPDFIIKYISSKNVVSYIILDAKYSRSNSVIKYGLPDIVRKYYLQTGVYDENINMITKTPIVSVVALHPLGKNNYFHNYYVDTKIKILPYLTGIPLNSEIGGRDLLDRFLSNIFINILNK